MTFVVRRFLLLQTSLRKSLERNSSAQYSVLLHSSRSLAKLARYDEQNGKWSEYILQHSEKSLQNIFCPKDDGSDDCGKSDLLPSSTITLRILKFDISFDLGEVCYGMWGSKATG